MKLGMCEITKEMRDEIEALKALPDERINTDDMPEVLDWSGARRGVFYRPNGRDDTRGDADGEGAGAQE